MSEKRIMNIAYGRPDINSDEGKKFWTTVGILIIGQNDQGEERISLKLNAIPLDAEFDGWLSVFPKDDNRESSHKNNATYSQNNTNVSQQEQNQNTATSSQPINEIAF